MKKFFGFVVAALVAVSANAGKQQVDSDSLKAVGKTGSYYGRADGLYHDATSKGMWVVENGELGGPVGQTYYEDFTKYGAAKGFSCLDVADGTACAGDSTTVPGLITMGDGLKLIQFPLATATLPVVTTAVGLDITGDLTNDEGFEVVGGVLGASGRPMIIGDDPAFYFCATVKLTDVSGTDDFHVGWRRAEAFTATFDNYNDLASIGAISGSIYIETILNNAVTTSTDTTNTWADAATKKLCVNVSGTGAVTYTIDGAAPATTAAFTFDDGDPVIPFVHLLHDTDVAETTAITKWEVGYTE